jgi:hypothetical protein
MVDLPLLAGLLGGLVIFGAERGLGWGFAKVARSAFQSRPLGSHSNSDVIPPSL